MAGVFLEVILNAEDFDQAGFEGRDEVEDPLHEALVAAGIGETSGGGGGSGVLTIDVDLTDESRLDEGLAVLRAVLRDLNVPRSTVVKRHKPERVVYAVYE
jgi:hypothetical protein